MAVRIATYQLAFHFALLELCHWVCVICALSWAGSEAGARQPKTEEEPTDEELMIRYVAGNERAFNVLMKRYQGKVYGYIYRHFLNEDKTSEIFQDCFYKVIRAADSFDPKRRFSTWLFTIVRNTIIDTFKKKKLRTYSLDAPLRPGDAKRSFGDVVPDRTSANGEQLARKSQLKERLREALETLNPDQKEVFVLRQFQGMPFAEIAVLMDCPVNTAKTRMRYALEALRRELREFI